ncbi:hypothetical protein MKUB_18210 [Mycobacterium kubicae]|uniref:Uncharacterized protein n=1 Tax=Mycobacterium kubicae TaxID=120959 RepID=A0AAX1JDU1_9MYCO|nr:hypothetical protein [Mycobacterium kubicae]MCV7097079.1 hypothetical protein [Mycobacterium kubicae]ORW03192.1 hypothetical protein AWC13_03165 [Mycobacterium kubicae]QNI11489.1 hypothetical protein GAN18_09925 [Mycobacterium kubicae]QPI39708.1 hypothetical protein I2456_09790 [Mycobacterium kubicae]GFG64331.1 hypothetical protein MKUB_18210 [Mycobacterium kubicae]
MLSAIVIIPCAPVLVPELAGTAAVELADLAAAVAEAAAQLPEHWVAVGVGPDEQILTDRTGTFAGFGVDLRVGLSPAAVDNESPGDLPLCALLAGWVRGRVRPQGSAQVRVYADGLAGDAALARGRQLRSEIDQAAKSIGVLVVADGVHTLTRAAPGGYEPANADAQLACDEALATGDIAALTGLPPQVLGRVAFQVLAGLAEPGPRAAKELYRGAPYGVGYFVGVWQP